MDGNDVAFEDIEGKKKSLEEGEDRNRSKLANSFTEKEKEEHKNKTQALFYRWCFLHGIPSMIGALFLLMMASWLAEIFCWGKVNADSLQTLRLINLNILKTGIGVLIADPIKSVVGIKKGNS